MAINVSQAFKRTSIAPIDETLALTKAQMVATVDTLMPAYYFTICQDDGKIYLYDKSATATVTTGKFTEFSGGGGGGGSEVFSTTATLDTDINDTTTVAAADLPGVSFSDITVGITLVRDAKGTIGLVTAKNGTTDVTVTTATISTPTKELTQAQYDLLTPAEKNNGTIYFVTDSQPDGGTYMGSYDTIYSTTEHVVGSFMGKPLYQKTLVQVLPTIETTGTQVVFSGVPTDVDMLVSAEGTGHYRSPYAHCGLANQWMGNYSSIETTIIVPNTTDGNFVIQLRSTNAALSGQTYYITIRYTKTTDTTSPVEYASPNDYSTSEKIVGTWIDGKPLYQKTIQATAPTPSGSTPGISYISLGVSVGKLIGYHGMLATNDGIDVPFGCFAYAEGLNVYVYENTATDTQRRNTVRLMNGNSAWAGLGAYITVQYTKAS